MTASLLAALEGTPVDDQKERLEDFFTELMLLTRKYQILLSDEHETVQIIDMPSGNLVGVGITYWTAVDDDRKVIEYTPADSILDGVWLVDTVDGPQEQHQVGSVFPRRQSGV